MKYLGGIFAWLGDLADRTVLLNTLQKKENFMYTFLSLFFTYSEKNIHFPLCCVILLLLTSD